jgi:hypothetical protein
MLARCSRYDPHGFHAVFWPLENYFNKDLLMPHPKYRIESSATLRSGLSLPIDFNHLYESSSLAVALAAKSRTEPARREVRVVQVPSGEIIFRTQCPD